VEIQVEVFWIMMLCSDAVRYKCLGETCCICTLKVEATRSSEM